MLFSRRLEVVEKDRGGKGRWSAEVVVSRRQEDGGWRGRSSRAGRAFMSIGGAYGGGCDESGSTPSAFQL